MTTPIPSVRIECADCRAAGAETAKWVDLVDLSNFCEADDLAVDVCRADDDVHTRVAVLETRGIPACALPKSLNDVESFIRLACDYTSLDDWDHFEPACMWADARSAEILDFEDALEAVRGSFREYADEQIDDVLPDWMRPYFDYDYYAEDLQLQYTVIEHNGLSYICKD